jgi:GDYXXLXY protein
VSSVPSNLAEKSDTPVGQNFFVTLDQATDGTWKPTRVTATRPATLAENQIVLKARSRYGFMSGIFTGNAGRGNLDVLYGIERYYVAEGTGPRLENLAREKKLEAVILALDAKGNAAIKGLIIEGKRVYDEPVL